MVMNTLSLAVLVLFAPIASTMAGASECTPEGPGVGAVVGVEASSHREGGRRRPGESFRDCVGCPQMVVIPAGSFNMGSPPNEAGRLENEGPRHRVSIRHPFALGKYAVTRAEFAMFARVSGHRTGGFCIGGAGWRDPGFLQGDHDPVVCVSWHDAKAYAVWIGHLTGFEYRLPSEAEWEYAARAGTDGARHWGDAVGRGRANCAHCGSDWDGRRSAPSGSFAANPFGLHEMLGNVWEWVEDCWNPSYAGAPAEGSAWTFPGCRGRVWRGGSWDYGPWSVRAASRSWLFPGLRGVNGGFRLARPLADGALGQNPDRGEQAR